MNKKIRINKTLSLFTLLIFILLLNNSMVNAQTVYPSYYPSPSQTTSSPTTTPTISTTSPSATVTPTVQTNSNFVPATRQYTITMAVDGFELTTDTNRKITYLEEELPPSFNGYGVITTGNWMTIGPISDVTTVNYLYENRPNSYIKHVESKIKTYTRNGNQTNLTSVTGTKEKMTINISGMFATLTFNKGDWVMKTDSNGAKFDDYNPSKAQTFTYRKEQVMQIDPLIPGKANTTYTYNSNSFTKENYNISISDYTYDSNLALLKIISKSDNFSTFSEANSQSAFGNTVNRIQQTKLLEKREYNTKEKYITSNQIDIGFSQFQTAVDWYETIPSWSNRKFINEKSDMLGFLTWANGGIGYRDTFTEDLFFNMSFPTSTTKASYTSYKEIPNTSALFINLLINNTRDFSPITQQFGPLYSKVMSTKNDYLVPNRFFAINESRFSLLDPLQQQLFLLQYDFMSSGMTNNDQPSLSLSNLQQLPSGYTLPTPTNLPNYSLTRPTIIGGTNP